MLTDLTEPVRPVSGDIVLVDDDTKFRNETRDILEEAGYRVMPLESANHALRHFEQQSWSWAPWLVLTDIVMGGMAGYQFIRLVNERFPKRTIPIVVVSRLGGNDDRTEAEMAGACAYLVKPFTPEALLTMVKKVTAPKVIAAVLTEEESYG